MLPWRPEEAMKKVTENKERECAAAAATAIDTVDCFVQQLRTDADAATTSGIDTTKFHHHRQPERLIE